MSTTALYQWNAAGSPVQILMDLQAVDRLRAAAIASEVEIGGLLLGYFEGNRTVVADFEPVESEHRRGAAYALSRRDDQRLISRIGANQRRQREVVGFFRSHLRPGMFLDAADALTLSGHFNNPQQVALLVRPTGDNAATGGFFFWEDGEMDRKQTILPFPMDSQALEASAPLQAAPVVARASVAETIERAAEPHERFAETSERLPEAFLPAAVAAGATPGASVSRGMNWPIIGLVAAGAALAGYFIGNSGHQERFGSRPGDITVGGTPDPAALPAPPPATPVTKPLAEAAPHPAPAMPSPTPALTSSQPTTLSPLPGQTTAEKAKAATIRRQQYEAAANTPPPAPAPVMPQREPVAQEPAPAPTPRVVQEPVPAHAFPHNPNPLPPPTPEVKKADTSVELESLQDGGLKHAVHKIPLFGSMAGTYKGGRDYRPAQVLRRTEPRVPPEVARELTAEVPVDLKLKVDNTGRVISVELLTRKSSPALAQLAGNAAYQWQFQPAQLKDQPVASDVIAHFRFRPTL